MVLQRNASGRSLRPCGPGTRRKTPSLPKCLTKIFQVVREKPDHKTAFARSQLAALVATGVDFGSLVFLVEVVKVYYVWATAIGAFLGALTNFLMGRHWSFEATHERARFQVLRYALVSGGSLGLNTV